MPLSLSQSYRLNLTYGAVQRHTLYAEAWMAQWVSDPVTQRVFAGLRKATGLGDKKTAIRFIEAVTKRSPSNTTRSMQKKIGATLASFVVHREQVPMPWLTQELVLAFVKDVGERAYHKAVRSTRRAESLHEPPLPPLLLDPPADLSETEVRNYFREAARLYLSHRRAVQRRVRGKTRAPRSKAADLAFEANVVYRRLILHEEPSTLWRDYREHRAKRTGKPFYDDGRKSVDAIVARWTRLLTIPRSV